MKPKDPLATFFEAVQRDPRISVTHIGIYAALTEYWRAHKKPNPFQAFSHEIMQLARITASTTYHKCVRDLHRYGYLRYEPSYDRNRGSRVYLVRPEKK
ncbi:hypothetical protein SAMN05216464_113103 [Mucilaginibacter pineti]|uniref:Helix-turn-helix domain-containing protein n=1 Tax=Mucilaginibacter pineti TaxID=1391627 RepID=A0A1G7IP26_9SPHI|nr:hypothetical protein [Mucilaginibacter pineti]SDF14365.1 hypothetical protein SAMN05216464_113103 [Mucilaginibacter pineti]